MQAMSGLLRAAACWAAFPLLPTLLEVSPVAGAKLFNKQLHPACIPQMKST